jgi:hypothetical protein
MRPLIILSFILTFNQTFSQITKDKALYNSKKGFIFQSTTLVIPEKNYFLFEHYTYGGGIFFANPYRDILYYQTDSYKSNNSNLYEKNGKYYLVDNKGKTSKIKFKVLEICSPEINLTRNWTYKEDLRYKLNDTIRKCFGSFHSGLDYGYNRFYSNEICSLYCNVKFAFIADSLYQHSLQLINVDFTRRAKRYSEFHDPKTEINNDFVDSFLNDFVSCRYDQNIFYELIISNTDLMISRINQLTETEYQQITNQIIGMPSDLDSKITLQKVKDSKIECKYKEKLLKDIKMYWR